ncbi:integral membrane protein [Streptomyces viridiviolaceus]|uniref:DoxX family protein n=1 Tax=Streptomyces viridiviolaceus TaxID=68282 RepID=A0ABW2DVX1_9ACTN|nr:DoxX family protein [Streptomyces viridiviolaceus]GHB34812.1 integral membrane protein [Streptomyces viridiviolaceus]
MTGRLNSAQPYALGLFRMVVGLLFACHGAASLFGVLGGAAGGGTAEAGTWPGWYAAVIQLVGGGLVLLGLGTRAAAVVASGSMAYAYFKVHQPTGLWPMENGGEASAMFCWAFLLLAFTGSGAFGLDRLFARRTSEQEQPAAEQTPVAA